MKSVKIKQKSKYLVLWCLVIALIGAVFVYSVLEWKKYREAQSVAIFTASTALPDKFNKNSSAYDIYRYITKREYIYSSDSKAMRAAKQEYNYAMSKVAESYNKALIALGYTDGAEYYLRYSSPVDLALYGKNRNEKRIVYAVAVLLFIYALISSVSYASDKSELIVDDESLTAKKHNGKATRFLIKDINSVASKGKRGLIIKGQNIKYRINNILNSGELKEAIEGRMAEIAKTSSNQKAADDPVSSTADELKKFKDLLDNGIITQEEFDAKKKQLLGL